MKFVQPQVFRIASTQVEQDGLQAFLDEVGAPEWSTDAEEDADALSEVAGRLCYKSFGVELNPNITRVREGNMPYVGNVLKQQHGSVFEHASASFAILGVSRIFTHELVRHRVGTAFSQESLRFVRLDALTAYYPEIGFGYDTLLDLWDSLSEEGRARARAVHGGAGALTEAETRERFARNTAMDLRREMQRTFEDAERVQRNIAAALYLVHCRSFDVKKLITSAMRRLAPEGLGTGIVYTSNHRALRDVIHRRTSRHAEEEIRVVFARIFELAREIAPAIYQDAKVDVFRGVPEITFETVRV
jgi:thymidylate synthase (FAD)